MAPPSRYSGPETPLTAAQRSLRARLAAYQLHATHDPRETTAAARAAQWQYYLAQVDPEGKLSAEERERRALAARRAHMIHLALLSSRARAKKGRPKR